jgi:hypothetical protein
MTQQQSEEYESIWSWFNALDAATDAADARVIPAPLASNRADVARSAGRGGTESGSQPKDGGLFQTS